jgi:chromosome partitioning protein
MRILCVLNEKGGVGKTTLCTTLAWHFVDTGKRVLAIDLDQQGNLTHTLLGNERGPCTALGLFVPNTKIEPAGPMTVAQSDADILDIEQTRDEEIPAAFRDNLRAADTDFDVCIIDTPPQLGIRVVAALIASHASVAPVDLGDYSLIGIKRMMEFQARVAAHFSVVGPEFYGLIASRFDRKSPRERALYEQLVEAAQEGVPIFPHAMTKRDPYARSSSERMPPWKMTGTAAREAAAEVRQVMAEFERRLLGP